MKLVNRRIARRSFGTALAAVLAIAGEVRVRADLPASHPVHTSKTREIVETIPAIDGDDLRFSRLSTAQGLSQTRVAQIVQDDRGFIWFSTQDGLNRYDGHTYRVFTHDPARDSSLSCVYISERALFKDRSGALWIGCDQSVDRYDAATETFRHYRIGDRRGDHPPIRVFTINEDRTGAIWLSTDDGLYRLDAVTGRTTHFKHDPSDRTSLSSNDVKMTAEDHESRFWVSDGGNIEEFDRDSGRVVRRIHVVDNSLLPVLFFEDSIGVVWVMYKAEGDSGLAVLDRATGRLTHYEIRDSESGQRMTAGIHAGLQDQNGTVWLATFGAGLLRLDRDRRVFVRYRTHANDVESIAEDRLIALAADREGNLWIGLNAMPPNVVHTRPSFLPLLRNAANPNGF